MKTFLFLSIDEPPQGSRLVIDIGDEKKCRDIVERISLYRMCAHPGLIAIDTDDCTIWVDPQRVILAVAGTEDVIYRLLRVSENTSLTPDPSPETPPLDPLPVTQGAEIRPPDPIGQQAATDFYEQLVGKGQPHPPTPSPKGEGE